MKARKAFSVILLLGLSTLSFQVKESAAERIYRSVGADGKISYSSEQPLPGAKPVELPGIEKKKMPPPQLGLQSCRVHGGTNCQAGADKDGSVICFDGYRKSPAVYKEHCDGTRIQVTSVSRRALDGAFIVTVRNSRSVAAKNVRILWKTEEEELVLFGAPSIAAFGMEEYILLFDHRPAAKRPFEVKNEDFRLHCDNCQWRSEELEIDKAVKAQADEEAKAALNTGESKTAAVNSASSATSPQNSPQATINPRDSFNIR